MPRTLQQVKDAYASTLPEDSKDRNAKIKNNGSKIFLRENIDLFKGEIKEAILGIVGTGNRGGGGGRVNPKSAVVAAIVAKNQMTDMDCFKDFKKGPSEMKDVIKYAIRNVKPEQRVWITFDNDTYKVVGKGPKPPANWNGYLPLDDEFEM